MLRGYNGKCYHDGSVVSTISKVHKGDEVQCTLDVGAGTLSLKVNGKDHGVVFTGLPTDGSVYPAVAFYGSDRCVRLKGPPPKLETGLTFGTRSGDVTVSDGGKEVTSHSSGNS